MMKIQFPDVITQLCSHGVDNLDSCYGIKKNKKSQHFSLELNLSRHCYPADDTVLQEDHQIGYSHQPINDNRAYSLKNSLDYVGSCAGIYCPCLVGRIYASSNTIVNVLTGGPDYSRDNYNLEEYF